MKVAVLKLLDSTLGFVLCWTVGWFRYLLRSDHPSPEAVIPAKISRILLIRPGGMGDMVLLLPVLKSLRRHFPQAAIHLVCEKRNRDILRLAGFSDGALLYDAHPMGLFRRVFQAPYDVAIDTEQFHYFSALMALLSRAPVRIGFKINPGRNLLYTHLVNYDLEGYEADQFMNLTAPLGLSERAEVEGCLTVDMAAVPLEVLRRLERLESTGGLVVVHAGSTSRYKHWAPENVAELIVQLGQGDSSLSFVLLGNSGEWRLAERVLEGARLGGRVISLTGQLTVAQSAAVIRRAVLYLGGDSGLAHVAVALGTPTVIWFGPSDSQKWGVRGPHRAVVRKQLVCSPCCIFGYHKLCRPVTCLRELTVPDVLQACREVMIDAAIGSPGHSKGGR
jgi:ADP-heptose:LPS heptosyltransferase